MKKTVLIFTSLIIALLLLFQLSKYSISSKNLKIEFIIGIIAIVFFFVGLYINKKADYKKESTPFIDYNKIKELGLTNREYEVLKEVAKGHSNLEIANTLFISESTIKTHVSNILLKLDVSRRAQAIQKAKELQILNH